ncbi:MAG: EamA family transporter [Clostridia bacterium]|nr:EamA family transporter [Clostridia bacterium]
MAVFLFCLVLVFTVAQSVSTKLYHKSGESSIVFNAIKALFSFVPLLVFSLFGFSFHTPTLLLGSLYGALMCVSMTSGYLALKSGPMALTSMLVSFSIVIPLTYGLCVGEVLNVFKIVGLCALVVAMVVVNLNKQNKESKVSYAKWLLFVSLTFVSNGVMSVIQKIHQTQFPSQFVTEFMTVGMFVGAVFFCVIALIKIKPKRVLQSKGKIFGVVAGICSVVANFCTTALVGMENASALFPAITAGTLVLNLILGLIIFREKLKLNHYIAVVFGVCAVVFLKL